MRDCPTETVTFKNNEFGTVTPNNPNWKRFYFQSLTGNFLFSGYFDREFNKMFSTSGVFNLNMDINNIYNVYMGKSQTLFVKIYENNDVGIYYSNANATMKITFI